MNEEQRIGSRGVISSPVPHHPAYGSVQGGSNQTRWPGLPSLSLHPNHISKSAIAALTLPAAPAAIIRVVEKVFGATSNLDVALVNLFLQINRENGYSVSQIDRKRLSLEGVLVPVTARWNEDLLDQ
jgi:hypothetical protein